MSYRNSVTSSKRKHVVDEESDESSIDSQSSDKKKNFKKQKVSESAEKDSDIKPAEVKYDFLKEALKKLHVLESEIAAVEEETVSNDQVKNVDCEKLDEVVMGFEAEAIGFAICASETLNYLASQGLTQDNPLVKSLRDRLVGKCQDILPVSMPRMK